MRDLIIQFFHNEHSILTLNQDTTFVPGPLGSSYYIIILKGIQDENSYKVSKSLTGVFEKKSIFMFLL